MIKDQHQYNVSLDWLKDFTNSLEKTLNQPNLNPLRQKLYVDSLQCQIEKLTKEINEYENRVIRPAV